MKNSRFAQRSRIASRRWTVPAQMAVLLLLAGGFSQLVLAQVSVTISPTLVTLATLATQQFTATVTGTTNTAVTWQVNGVAGGNSTVGLVTTTIPGTAGESLYLGPSSVPSPATVSVTAVSQADSTKSASATVTVQVPSRSGVTYYVATTANTVHPGDTVQVEGGVYNE